MDFTIQRAVLPGLLGLMLAAGMWWMTQPIPNAGPQGDMTPEVEYAPWVAAGGLALTAVAWGVLARRYVLVRKILSQGTPIKGTAVVVDRYDTNSHSDSDTAPMQFTPTYVYYVTLRYVVEAVERKVRLRLPYSPGTYGIKEEGEVELLVRVNRSSARSIWGASPRAAIAVSFGEGAVWNFSDAGCGLDLCAGSCRSIANHTRDGGTHQQG